MMVAWTIGALQSLQVVHAHIASENPVAAKRVIKQLKRLTDKLSEFPNMGRTGLRQGTREIVNSNLPYIVVYRVKAGEVQILRVFDAT